MTQSNYPGGSFPAAGGYPNYPPMPQLQGVADPSPSGGTAITAGVLGVLGGLFVAFLSWVTFELVDLVERSWREAGRTPAEVAAGRSLLPDWFDSFTTAAGIAYAGAALLLLVGACLLLMRGRPGRWLLVVGCALVIGAAIAGIIAGPALVDDVVSAARARYGPQVPEPSLGVSATGPTVFVVILPALATLVLAVLPQTGRWVDAGRRRPVQPPYPQQYPGQW